MDAGATNSIGRMLQSLRMDDEADLIVSFGAHGPSYDCRNGHVSATIRRGKDEATSEAVSLIDALYLARAKLDDMAAKREKAAAKNKPAPTGSEARSPHPLLSDEENIPPAVGTVGGEGITL